MIVGITGTLGAGKGTIAEYLLRKHNFTYFSVRNFLTGEVVRQGRMVSHETIVEVASALRAKSGPASIVEGLLAEALQQTQVLRQRDVVIESIRLREEAAYLKSKNAWLWSVDADRQTRYQRTLNRDAVIKVVSFEQFSAEEEKEENLKDIMTMADIRLQNDGTKEALFADVEKALAQAKDAHQS